ncbi:MAG: hypothetical protein IJE10_11270 [Clostridia bacterium]|nr:hypothetical protein [Clostridia bacterium]
MQAKTAINLLSVAIVFILIIGFVGGIMYGNSLKMPTEYALRAIDDMERIKDEKAGLMYWIDDEYEVLAEVSKETEWTLSCTISMLGVWVVSALIALMLYAKSVQLQIADEILDEVKKIESKKVVKTVTRTVMQKQAAESEPAKNTNE